MIAKEVQNRLLPNEEVLFSCPTQEGLLVLSDRRMVIVKLKGRFGYHIDRAIPYDYIRSFVAKKKDRLSIITDESATVDLKVPERDSVISQCTEILDEVRNSRTAPPTQRDYSYLRILPESLTRDAILDLNTVLRDQPVHYELVHEAKAFLGDEPFLLEESLRDGDDRNNGILFAAGKRGYYWIRGNKQGRFMKNVIVDTVEWDNVYSLTHRWQDENPLFYVKYSPTKGGKPITSDYIWSPPAIEDSNHCPWLMQPMNGPWILADIMYRYSGRPMPSSHSITETPRFYH